MLISIHPFKVFKRFGYDEGFAMLKRSGIDAIQFGMGAYFFPAEDVRANKPSVLDGDLPAVLEAARPYKEAAEKNGVQISHVHAPYPMWIEGREDINGRMLDVMRKSIAVTAYMNCRYCLIHPAFPRENKNALTPDAEWELNKRLYSALIPDLKKYNVMVLMENLFSIGSEGLRYSGPSSDAHEVVRWMDELNAMAGGEYFGFCLDTGHCNLARQNLPRTILILGSHLKALHLHDNDGHLDQHLAPYSGTIDWDAVLSALKAVHYQGDLNFETNIEARHPASMDEECFRFVSAIGRHFIQKLTEA